MEMICCESGWRLEHGDTKKVDGVLYYWCIYAQSWLFQAEKENEQEARALSTIKAFESQLNSALERNDISDAKIYKKHLIKALKDYYGI